MVDWSLGQLFAKQKKLISLQAATFSGTLDQFLETYQKTSSSRWRLAIYNCKRRKQWLLGTKMRSKRIITRVALDFLWHSWMKREDERTEAYSYHRLTWTWQVDSWPALILRLSQKPSRLYHTSSVNPGCVSLAKARYSAYQILGISQILGNRKFKVSVTWNYCKLRERDWGELTLISHLETLCKKCWKVQPQEMVYGYLDSNTISPQHSQSWSGYGYKGTDHC